MKKKCPLSTAHVTSALLGVALLVGCERSKVVIDSANGNPASESTPRSTPDESTALHTNEAWPLFRGNAQATGVVAGQLPEELKVLWQYAVAGDNPGIEASAVIADGTVFVANLEDAIEAVDLETGKRKWTCKTAIGFAAPPAVKDGRVFVGDLDGVFYAIDASSGEVKWKFETKAEINSSANFYNDLVLVGSQDNSLYALDAESGDLKWSYEINDQVQCMPTVIGDLAFLAGCDSTLHLIDLKTGKSTGGVPLDNPTNCTPAALGDFVYLGTQAASFSAINWREEKAVWKYVNPKRQLPFESSAAVTDDLVLVGGRDKLLRALNSTDGKVAWQTKTKSAVNSSPVVVGQRVFAGTDRGRLLALDLASGDIVWQYEAGGSFTASAAVAQGKLVIGNTDGTLYCFGSKPE